MTAQARFSGFGAFSYDARRGFGAPCGGGFGCVGGPEGTRGMAGYAAQPRSSGFAGAWCGPFSDFVLDSTRIEWANNYYLNKYKVPLPQRVRDKVVADGFCSQASLVTTLNAMPPVKSDTISTDVANLPPPGPPTPSPIPQTNQAAPAAGPGGQIGMPQPQYFPMQGPPPSTGLSQNAKIGLALGALALVGALYAYRS